MMKVFKLNDCDWWMAETLEQALSDAAKEFGISEDEVSGNPYELDDYQLKSHTFTDREAENSPTRTFKDELIRRVDIGAKSELFASTEY